MRAVKRCCYVQWDDNAVLFYDLTFFSLFLFILLSIDAQVGLVFFEGDLKKKEVFDNRV